MSNETPWISVLRVCISKKRSLVLKLWEACAGARRVKDVANGKSECF